MECFKCGKVGHYAKECRSATCYNCGKIGHIAKFCRVEKKEKNLLTEEEDEEEIGILMMTRSTEAKLHSGCVEKRSSNVELNSGYSNSSIWYLDTGASNHMCGEESFFSELTKMEAGFVSFGDDSKVAVKGCGTIRHMQKDGRVGEIRDVYYVPELKSNILSMGQMMEKDNSVMMKDRGTILKGQK